MHRKWSKIDELDLVRFVDPNARAHFPIRVNLLDLQHEAVGLRQIAKEIYNALLLKNIQYSLEPRTTSQWQPTQEIRLAQDILAKREGTCLELALLFCGLCLGYELVPILIVLDQHALVAVSTNYTLRNHDRRRGLEDEIFKNVLVRREREKELREILTSGAYFAIECTGFAFTQTLQPPNPEGTGREPSGMMSFDRAVAAGAEQLEPIFGQPFKFALDIAVAHYFHEMQPLASADGYRRHYRKPLRPENENGPLPYLMDRSEQAKAFRHAVLRHRANASRRPLVCLIHGDQQECHLEFVERLQQVSIPAMLKHWNPGNEQRTPFIYRVTIPSFEGVSEVSWKQLLWEALAVAMSLEEADPETVIGFVSAQPRAAIIEFPILLDRLVGDPVTRINAILEFWSQWPNVPVDLLFVVCLSFKYQQELGARRKWRPWSKGLTDEVRSFLQSDEVRERNISSVCLPELQSIEQTDAEEAVNNPAISQRYHLTERDIRQIYRRPDLISNHGRISMDDLLNALLQLNSERIG